jgi:Tol biopolymer transport system component
LRVAIALVLTMLTAPVARAQPEIFAPGVISGPANDGAPAFAPDGQTLLFTRSGANGGFILESHRVNGAWTVPVIAAFSGEWNDQHPAMAPDGSYLVFASTRPVPGTTDKVAHLWRVDRTKDGWGTPVHLPATVNIMPRIFKPSVAADGSIYFLGIGEHRVLAIYRARRVGAAYAPAERLPFSDSASADVDPEIAPDQSFLVFASAGRRSGDGKEHLYIVFQHDGKWGDVKPLRYAGDDENGGSTDNEPKLAPDGRTLYFSSDRTVPVHLPRTRVQSEEDLKRIEAWDNGNTNVWSISLAPFLTK